MERVSAPRIDDREVLAFVLTRRDDARFAVVMPCILVLDCRAIEDQSRPQKIDSPLLEDMLPFALIPGESHAICTLLCTQSTVHAQVVPPLAQRATSARMRAPLADSASGP
jgi:hypothetical protein